MTQPATILTVGIQGPPGPLAASVATLAALASLPPSGIPWPQGTPAFSQASGGTSWAWYPTGATPPAGATTTAGNGGLWVQQPSGPATLTAPTPAALSALAPGSPYPAGTSAQVAAPFGRYTLVPTYSGPYDVCHVQASTAAGGGAWVLSSFLAGSVPATECGADATGATDSSAALQAAMTALAGTGAWLWIPHGTYKIANPVVVPSNCTILGSAGASLISTIPTSGAPTQSLFYANVTQGAAGAVSGSISAGAASVTLQALVAGASAGAYIQLQSSTGVYRYETRQIVSTSNGGLTLKLDRPLRYTYANGNTALVVVPPVGIRVLGCGMTLSGTGCRMIEFAGAYDSIVDDVTLDLSAGSGLIGMSWDVDSYRSVGQRIRVNGQNATYGLLVESSERCGYEDCEVSDPSNSQATLIGLCTFDGNECYFLNSGATGCNIGLRITDDGSGLGSNDTQVDGGRYDGNAYGIQNYLNSQRTTVSNVSAQYNSTCGVLDEGTAAKWRNITAANNTAGTGMQLAIQATGTLVDSLDVSNCNTAALFYADQAQISNVYCGSVPNSGIQFGDGTHVLRMSARGVVIVGFNLEVDANCVCDLTDCQATIAPGGYGLVVFGAARVRNYKVRLSGASTGTTGAVVESGGTLRDLGGCDFDACATPLSVLGGGFCNRKQTVVANGTTGVDVAWPDIKSTDSVTFVLKTIGGTVGHPKYTITAGTKFTLTSDASDTSTYEYLVQ